MYVGKIWKEAEDTLPEHKRYLTGTAIILGYQDMYQKLDRDTIVWDEVKILDYETIWGKRKDEEGFYISRVDSQNSMNNE